jgi:hypothetical protein
MAFFRRLKFSSGMEIAAFIAIIIDINLLFAYPPCVCVVVPVPHERYRNK